MMEKLYQLFLECFGVSTDTRTIQQNNLFFCLKGENFDGNKFAKDAVDKGARYVVIDEKEYEIEGKTFLVDDCLTALQKLANFHRRKFNIPFIGITGSNGKTTTKELTAHLLDQHFKTLATIGNLNNQIGVPLTLLRLTKEHEIAVIEMGANHPGDIADLCEIAEPTHGLITSIGKAHLLGFKNIEGVIETKTAMYRSVVKNKGTLFIHVDNPILTENQPKDYTKIVYYSGKENPKATTFGKLLKLTPFIHLTWHQGDYFSPELETQIIGEYNFNNLLTAITVAKFFGVENKEINEAISTYRNENNRSQLTETDNNRLIMDAYNANPSSMKLAIESFEKIEANEKTMILGDMFELGDESFAEHQTIVKQAEKTEIPTYFIGSRFFEHKNNGGNFFEKKEDFANFLKQNPLKNHLILLKGSRGISLETLKNLL